MADSKSWSRLPSKMIKMCHVMTIENFSLRNEKVLYSSPFSSPQDTDKKWRLEVYPNGNTEEDKDYVDFFLCLTGHNHPQRSWIWLLMDQGMDPDETDQVNVNFTFKIQDDKDEGGLNYTHRAIHATYTKTSPAWGVDKLCKRADILDKLPNDVLKVTCKFNYVNDAQETLSGAVESTNQTLKCDNDLSSDLSVLLIGNDQFSDVILCVGAGGEARTTEFRSHRAILSVRSPYFAAMFAHEFRENVENKVEISGVKPEVFREILSFIYTGSFEPNKMAITESVAKEILVAADRFALDKLKTLVENCLVSKLTIENVLDLMGFADTHSAEILKAGAKDFVAKNAKQVMETDGWQMIVQERNARPLSLMTTNELPENNDNATNNSEEPNLRRSLKRKKVETTTAEE